VRPGVVDTEARCLLKTAIFDQVHSPCCIAGIERQAAAEPGPAPPVFGPAPSSPMPDTNMLGFDYKHLDGTDPAACESACKADNQCRAWTFVRPGVQGPAARCHLKASIPERTASPCCVSGIERPEAQ